MSTDEFYVLKSAAEAFKAYTRHLHRLELESDFEICIPPHLQIIYSGDAKKINGWVQTYTEDEGSQEHYHIHIDGIQICTIIHEEEQ